MENITLQRFRIIGHFLKDDGIFPNNDRLPLLIYKNAVHPENGREAEAFEELFAENGWTNSWRGGIYEYEHYHSITHEVLGVFRGSARIEVGGEHGIVIEVKKGDVIIIPAGVAHKNLESTGDFACVGAYPEGSDYDMNYGNPKERERALPTIASVPIPAADPVCGKEGKLFKYWK